MIYIKIQNLARRLIIHPDLSVEWCFVWQSVNIFSYQSDNSSQDYIPTDTARQIDFQNLWGKLVRFIHSEWMKSTNLLLNTSNDTYIQLKFISNMYWFSQQMIAAFDKAILLHCFKRQIEAPYAHKWNQNIRSISDRNKTNFKAFRELAKNSVLHKYSYFQFYQ